MTKRNLEASIDIDAAPNQVWHVVSDLKRLPEWSPQCQRMQLLGRLREGVYTLNWNRQGRKFWPSASKLVRVESNQPVAFARSRITASGRSKSHPPEPARDSPSAAWFPRTAGVSTVIVKNLIGEEDSFDDEMIDGIKTTVARAS